MPEEMEIAVVDALKKLGYTNVEGNCGVVWYTDNDGQTWSLSPNMCD